MKFRDKFKEDCKKGKWYAVKELWFSLHYGRKTLVFCIVAGIGNWFLPLPLWAKILATEYLVVEFLKKMGYESEGMYQ